MQERMLFVDAPFILTNILNDGHPVIMEHRYGSIITQMWPWLGSEIGLGMPVLMHIYNASFNLFYLIVCGILVFRLRTFDLAILMALYYALMVSDAFYWTNNEIHQAMAWMFLWLGVHRFQIKNKTSMMWTAVNFGALGTLAILTHPLMIPIVIFVWLYELMESKIYNSNLRQTSICSFILIAGIALRLYLSLYGGWYDAGKISVISESGFGNIFGFLQKPLFDELMRHYGERYLMTTILFIATIAFLIFRKKYHQMGLMVCFVIGYNVLFLTAFDEFIPFYSESELMPLTILVGLPLVMNIGEILKPGIISILFILVFTLRIFMVISAATPYENRIVETNKTLNYMKAEGITKMVLPETPENKQLYIMSWGLPVESLLASIISGDPIQRTFKIVAQSDLPSYENTASNIWLDCFKSVPIQKMNNEYFQLDSLTDYRIQSVK